MLHQNWWGPLKPASGFTFGDWILWYYNILLPTGGALPEDTSDGEGDA